ncbi:glycosyl hydrolase family 18 protein [Ammoniphilus sp. YIM 78166]|uniref:glycosyl hydrolase family 18 protein n=1 Tax=Ammoniphilus sp. YIM 78166 TaxID=1644106 RepID=UPI00106FEFB6|nr:glycosyl hydrolase family 18 protein [Ammoniphilus sp. YIM 78166]
MLKKALFTLIIMISLFIPVDQLEAAPNANNMLYLYGESTETYIKQLSVTKNLAGTLVPGYFDIDADGNLIDHVDPAFVQYAHDHGYKITPFISNHWDYELGQTAMEKRVKLAHQLADAVLHHNVDGVDFDIENLREHNRDEQTEFLQILVDRLRPHNKTVSIAMAPISSDTAKGWFGSYDLEAIGKLVDKVFIMAYEQHWIGGPSGPQAGLGWTEATVRYLSTHIPKEKLVLGIPFFGRYWTEDVKGLPFTFAQAEDVIKQNGAQLEWDEEYQTTFARFVSQDTGKEYEIWIDNAESLIKKVALVQEYGLSGWGGWRLGQEDPLFWDRIVGDRIAAEAKKHVGSPITHGSAPFVSQVFGQIGLDVPGRLKELYELGVPVEEQEQLQPGDVVFFGTNIEKLTATGIYTGDGSFVVAYKPYGTIQEIRLSSNEAAKYYVGAKRVPVTPRN